MMDLQRHDAEYPNALLQFFFYLNRRYCSFKWIDNLCWKKRLWSWFLSHEAANAPKHLNDWKLFPNIWFQHLTRACNTQLTRGIFRDSQDFLLPLHKITIFHLSQGAQTNLKKKSFFVIQKGPNQPWEYRIAYRSKPEISNLFIVSKNIEYQIPNIGYLILILHFFAEKVLF